MIRLAREDDISGLEALIPLSVRALQEPYYTPKQMDAALGPVFGLDRQLIQDGTYFVAEHEGQLVGCGGWSKRKSLFGGSAHAKADESELDPKIDSARVRAFFVHPSWARRGIGRSILLACEAAIREAGFHQVELVATLGGEPLYASLGFTATRRYAIELPHHLTLPVVGMRKDL